MSLAQPTLTLLQFSKNVAVSETAGTLYDVSFITLVRVRLGVPEPGTYGFRQ